MLTKLSRYEFEKLRHKNLNESQLEEVLKKRGSDYSELSDLKIGPYKQLLYPVKGFILSVFCFFSLVDMLLYHHTLHKNCEAMVKNTLEEKNIETKVGN